MSGERIEGMVGQRAGALSWHAWAAVPGAAVLWIVVAVAAGEVVQAVGPRADYNEVFWPPPFLVYYLANAAGFACLFVLVHRMSGRRSGGPGGRGIRRVGSWSRPARHSGRRLASLPRTAPSEVALRLNSLLRLWRGT